MELINEATTLTQSGNLINAEKMYYEARTLLPDSPVPDYHLALLYSQMGQNIEGQKFYQEALTKDPSYRTPYNSLALNYYGDKHYKEAEKEYKKVLELDPCDAYAYLGLGKIATGKKQWDKAKTLFKKSLELDEYLTDAYRSLGDIYTKLGSTEEAIIFYERSLKLALEGHKPIDDASIFTCTGEGHKKDLDHCNIHAKLADLYTKKGCVTEAISGYKISIAGGYDSSILRIKLACLYIKQHQWQKAIKEIYQSTIKMPSDLWEACRDFTRQISIVIKHKYTKETL